MTSRWDAAVAAHGLETNLGYPGEVLDDSEWAMLLSRSRAERLTGFLAAAVTDGRFPTSDEQYEEIADAHLEAMGVALRLERLLLRVDGLLGGAGIDIRVLKGPAVAHHLYPDPNLRPFGDVDVLVHSERFDRAVEVIGAAGGVRQFPQPRPGFDRRFSKGTSFAMPCKLELDLHRTFVSGPFGLTVCLVDLWEGSWAFELGGVELLGLDLETCFLNLCYHAALGDATPKLLALRDIAQAVIGHPLDSDRVLRMAHTWRAEPVLALAMNATVRTLGMDTSHHLIEWARAYEPDRSATRAMAAYARPGNAYGRQAVAALRVIPQLADKAAYVRALAWPDRSYIDGRYRSRWNRWGRGLRTVGRLRRGV